MAQLM